MKPEDRPHSTTPFEIGPCLIRPERTATGEYVWTVYHQSGYIQTAGGHKTTRQAAIDFARTFEETRT